MARLRGLVDRMTGAAAADVVGLVAAARIGAAGGTRFAPPAEGAEDGEEQGRQEDAVEGVHDALPRPEKPMNASERLAAMMRISAVPAASDGTSAQLGVLADGRHQDQGQREAEPGAQRVEEALDQACSRTGSSARWPGRGSRSSS